MNVRKMMDLEARNSTFTKVSYLSSFFHGFSQGLPMGISLKPMLESVFKNLKLSFSPPQYCRLFGLAGEDFPLLFLF